MLKTHGISESTSVKHISLRSGFLKFCFLAVLLARAYKLLVMSKLFVHLDITDLFQFHPTAEGKHGSFKMVKIQEKHSSCALNGPMVTGFNTLRTAQCRTWLKEVTRELMSH